MRRIIWLLSIAFCLTFAATAQAAPITLNLEFDKGNIGNKSEYSSFGYHDSNLFTGIFTFDPSKAVSTSVEYDGSAMRTRYDFHRKDISYSLGGHSLDEAMASLPQTQLPLYYFTIETSLESTRYGLSSSYLEIWAEGPNANYPEGQNWVVSEYFSYTVRHGAEDHSDPNFHYNGRGGLEFKHWAVYEEPPMEPILVDGQLLYPIRLGETWHVFEEFEISAKDDWIYPSGYYSGGLELHTSTGLIQEVYMDAPMPVATPLPAGVWLLAGGIIPLIWRNRSKQ